MSVAHPKTAAPPLKKEVVPPKTEAPQPETAAADLVEALEDVADDPDHAIHQRAIPLEMRARQGARRAVREPDEGQRLDSVRFERPVVPGCYPDRLVCHDPVQRLALRPEPERQLEIDPESRPEVTVPP